MISTNAFSGCTALNTVNFDDDTAASLTINLGAFANCTALTFIELPARLSSTRYNFLYGCDALTSITMKDGAQKFATVDNVLYNVSDDEAVMVVYPGGKPGNGIHHSDRSERKSSNFHCNAPFQKQLCFEKSYRSGQALQAWVATHLTE